MKSANLYSLWSFPLTTLQPGRPASASFSSAPENFLITTLCGALREHGVARRRVLLGHRVLQVLLVLGADVLPNFVADKEVGGPLDGPGFQVRAWIVDRDFVLQMTEIGTPEALNDVKLIRVGAAHRGPAFVVEPRRVHHQRVAFPSSNRM